MSKFTTTQKQEGVIDILNKKQLALSSLEEF